MLDSQLEYRLKRLGVPPKKARSMTAKVRDLYFPAAVVADAVFADPFSPLGCTCLGALGINMQSTASTAGLVGTGAQAGNMIVPGIGGAIGAAAGAAVAALKHVLGNHDVRVSGAQQGECANFLSQYAQAASQAGPETTLGPQLGIDNLEKINWCFAAVYGGPVRNVDPRFFSIGWQQAVAYAKALVNAAFTMPAGASWTSAPITGNTADGKHPNTRPPVTVTLPNPLTFAGLSNLVAAYMIASCSAGNKSAGNCPAYWHNSVGMRLLMDLCGYWISVQFPQVFNPPPVKATPAVVEQASAVVAKTATTTVVDPTTGTPVTVPVVSPGTPSGYVPTGNPTVDAVGTQMADDGVNMNSPQAKQVLADVAAEGVVKTPAGPTLQAGFGIAGAVLLGLLFLGSKSHGR